eukprot:gene12066-biopygen273
MSADVNKSEGDDAYHTGYLFQGKSVIPEKDVRDFRFTSDSSLCRRSDSDTGITAGFHSDGRIRNSFFFKLTSRSSPATTEAGVMTAGPATVTTCRPCRSLSPVCCSVGHRHVRRCEENKNFMVARTPRHRFNADGRKGAELLPWQGCIGVMSPRATSPLKCRRHDTAGVGSPSRHSEVLKHQPAYVTGTGPEMESGQHVGRSCCTVGERTLQPCVPKEPAAA